MLSACITQLIVLLILSLHGSQSLKSCQSDAECFKNGVCEQNYCHCKIGFVIAKKQGAAVCIKVAENIGDECEKDNQCSVSFGPYAFCASSETMWGHYYCACRNDSHFVDGLCYKNAFIGEPCSVNNNCIVTNPGITAYCAGGYCVCPPYYNPKKNGTECVPGSELDETCDSDDDCIAAESYCADSTCRCKIGYVHSTARNSCLEVTHKLGGTCYEHRQCTSYMSHTVCDPTRFKCVCAPYAIERNGECWVKVDLNEECDATEECWIPSDLRLVQCLRKKCTCIAGFEPNDKLDCVLGRGRSHRVAETWILMVLTFLLLTL